MAEQSSKPEADGGKAEALSWHAFYSQLKGMSSALWTSRQRNKILMLGVALVAVVGATAYMQIRLNAWNKPFYDSLARKDLSEFIQQIGVFAALAGILLVLNVAQTWLNQTSKVILRQGLVDDLMAEWLTPFRAFRLTNAGEIGANPDQRIQQDAQHLTDLTTDLGIGLLQSSLLLLSFIGVLWVLSSGMVLSIGGRTFAPPGYMVWCALLYAGIASFVSWLVGRPLINLNAERYAREADFRFALVRTNEEIEGITLFGGEGDERSRLEAVFGSVIAISKRIVGAVTRLTWVTAGYGWFTIIAPILVAAPAYFRSGMSFGELMVIVGAFNQVQQALRWFVDNFASLADWRATLLRVAIFRKTMLTMDELGRTTSRINFKEAEEEGIKFDDLRVSSPQGCIKLSEPHTDLKAGDRLLIIGENSEEKALLFRAMGGLWPWGSGRITHPTRRSILFLPVRAYVPPGPLRACLAYPHSADVYDDAILGRALAKVGLENLVTMLDSDERWDRRLTDEEKQCVAIARIILQKPSWVVANDALDVLDPESRGRIQAIFQADLANVGMINIGHAAPDRELYARTLHVLSDPHGPIMEPVRRPGVLGAPEPAGETLSAE
jgi:putative ATP-binding cassette transporter